MSLTEAPATVLASMHEDGINQFALAFFKARPRHLNYGSPSFVPSTTVNGTQIPPISFPGLGSGIQYAIQFEIPTVDLSPDSSGGTAPLVPGPNQLGVHTRLTLCVECGRRNPDDPTGGNPDNIREQFIAIRRPYRRPLCTELEIFAIGEPFLTAGGGGAGVLSFRVVDLEIVDIKPESLENTLECVVLQIFDAVLRTLQLPIPALSAGAFDLTLLQLRIEDDQIKVFGTV